MENCTEYLFCGKYKGYKFTFEGREAEVAFPEKQLDGKPWVLKAHYNTAFPAVELKLMEAGFARAYLKTANGWGTDIDNDAKARFVKFLHDEFGFAEKCVPVGYSCGGMHTVKFTARHPECVAVMYIDAPVINLLDWPMMVAHPDVDYRKNAEDLYKTYGTDFVGMLAFRDHPLDRLPKVIAAKVPCCMVYGDDDKVVHWEENAKLVNEMYADSGVDFMSVCVPGRDHHPHEPLDFDAVVDFIMKHIG